MDRRRTSVLLRIDGAQRAAAVVGGAVVLLSILAGIATARLAVETARRRSPR